MNKGNVIDREHSPGAAGRAPRSGPTRGARAVLARWRRRGASAVESIAVTGTVALGAMAGYHAMGTTISAKITCLGEQMMGDGASEGCRGDGDNSIGPTAGAIRGADPPLTTRTFRVTDDISDLSKVTPNNPGRDMEVAGNSTETYLYGRQNVVGVCQSLASDLGIPQNALLSGGMCLQVGNYPTIFRAEDNLEDGQDCGSPQHLDFQREEYDHVQQYLAQHPDQAHYVPVSCGSHDQDITAIYRDYDPTSDAHKQIRFDNADGPVTDAVLHINGEDIHGTLQSNGSFLFEDPSGHPITGQGTFTLTVHEPNGTTRSQQTTLDIPKASDIAGTQVHGNDTRRGGLLDTLDEQQGETAQQAISRANTRRQCIQYLTAHPDATRSQAEAAPPNGGGCAP